MSDDDRLPDCPVCGREHLYGLTWRHETGCPHYSGDTPTGAADAERRRGVRPLTETEQALIAGAYVDPPEGWELAVKFDHVGGIHHREVVERQASSGRVTRPAERTDDA